MIIVDELVIDNQKISFVADLNSSKQDPGCFDVEIMQIAFDNKNFVDFSNQLNDNQLDQICDFVISRYDREHSFENECYDL